MRSSLRCSAEPEMPVREVTGGEDALLRAFAPGGVSPARKDERLCARARVKSPKANARKRALAREVANEECRADARRLAAG